MKKRTIVVAALIAGIILVGGLVALYINSQNTNLLSKLEDDEMSAKKLSEAKLTLYFSGEEPLVTREVLDQLEQKAKKDLNIKVDFKFIAGNRESYLNQMKSIIASDTPCDAYYYSSSFLKDLRAIVKEGMAKDITKLYPLYAPNYYRGFSRREIAVASINKKVYAVTQRLPSTQMRCAIVREDYMKKYHIPEIKSYADYEVYLQTIKENEPGITPMIYYETSIGLFAEANGYVVLNYWLGLVYKRDDPKMRIIPWEQAPEYRRGIETIQKWMNKGYLLKDLYVGQLDDTVISTGRFASFIAPLDMEIRANSVLKSKDISWKYKAYPLYPERIAERNSPLIGAMIISPRSKNAERTLMFINWLQSKQENYDALMYGVKGKHYQLEGEAVSIPESMNQARAYYNWPWRWPLENIEFERPDYLEAGDLKKEYLNKIETLTKYPPHMGFTPDYGSLEKPVYFRRASFYTVDQNIYSGLFKPSDIDAYITEQKSQGVGKIVAEVQKQMDRWLASEKKEAGN